MGSGHGWLAGDWPSTGGILNITAAAWTAGFQWWHSGNITRMQNFSIPSYFSGLNFVVAANIFCFIIIICCRSDDILSLCSLSIAVSFSVDCEHMLKSSSSQD